MHLSVVICGLSGLMVTVADTGGSNTGYGYLAAEWLILTLIQKKDVTQF